MHFRDRLRTFSRFITGFRWLGNPRDELASNQRRKSHFFQQEFSQKRKESISKLALNGEAAIPKMGQRNSFGSCSYEVSLCSCTRNAKKGAMIAVNAALPRLAPFNGIRSNGKNYREMSRLARPGLRNVVDSWTIRHGSHDRRRRRLRSSSPPTGETSRAIGAGQGCFSRREGETATRPG